MTNHKPHTTHTTNQHSGFFLMAAVIYIALLSYGTLYPLSNWQFSAKSPLVLFSLQWPERTSWSDLVTNFVVYIPLGLLLYMSTRRRNKLAKTAFIITSIGLFVSFSLEYLQLFLPSRVTSIVDITLNSIGTLIGASIAIFFQSNSALNTFITKFKEKRFRSDQLTNIGLLAIAFWAASHVMPFVPSLGMSNLRAGLKPIWYTINDFSLFKVWQLFTYVFFLTAIGLIYKTLVQNYATKTRGIFFFFAFILFLKIPIVTRQLSLEALLGLFISILLLELLITLRRDSSLKLSALLIILGFMVSSLHMETQFGTSPRDMNWIPFSGQMLNLLGLTDILQATWPFVALAYIGLALKPDKVFFTMTFGTLFVFIATICIEWGQQYIPGRSPDITDVALATIAFSATCFYHNRQPRYAPSRL